MFAADAPVKDTVKVWDKGFDVRNYLNSSRYKTPAHTVFNKKSFFSNTFIGVKATAMKISGEDYGFGPTAGGVIGKWVHPSVAVRLGADLGYWYDNFDACRIRALGLSASVLFNMMSYLGGYNTSRFCEMSVVAGAGFTHVWKTNGDNGDALSGHVGLNVDMRVFDRLHIYVEPQIVLYLNPRQGSTNRGITLSSAGNWRSYMPAYGTTVGMSYTFGQTRPQNSRMSGSLKDPKMDWNGYFISAQAGIQVQANSRLVWKGLMTPGERAGMHFSFGFGRWYNDFFGLRITAAYARNNWIKYMSLPPMATRYVSLRFEGMLDLVDLISKGENRFFSLAVLAGPEMGHVLKYDRIRNIHDHYVGLVGGVQARFNVHKWVTVVAEPRFALVPYSAPNNADGSVLDNANYYDGLLNFNVGLEINIPAYHKPSSTL